MIAFNLVKPNFTLASSFYHLLRSLFVPFIRFNSIFKVIIRYFTDWKAVSRIWRCVECWANQYYDCW